MEVSMSNPKYSLQDIPGKGKGLVASETISRGTRILSEEPIITNTEGNTTQELQKSVNEQFKALNESTQQAFLSMHNMYEVRNASELICGIYQTNALPIEANGIGGGIFLEACRINHACDNNAENHWNDNIKRHTVHALRDIGEGEEITIDFLDSHSVREVRQKALRDQFKFDCTCRLCSLPMEQSQESDRRLKEIGRLERLIGARSGHDIVLTPLLNLRYVERIVSLYNEQAPGDPGMARAYFDATQIALVNGDLARGSIFAEKAVLGWQVAFGSDSKEVIEYGNLVQDPSNHWLYNRISGHSTKWKTTLDEKPHEVEGQDYEDWLWKRKKIMGLRNNTAFPSFEGLPNEYDLEADSNHWCYLGEIVDGFSLVRLELDIKDIDDDMTKLFFHTNGRGDEVASSIKVGYTVAVLDAKRRHFLDGQFGIRLENERHFKVFPLSLHELFTINDQIQEFSALNVDGTRKCHGCGKRANSLHKCGRCSYFWYCGKDCQIAGWYEKGHKSTCKLLKDPDLRLLFFFNMDKHEGPLEFPLPMDPPQD